MNTLQAFSPFATSPYPAYDTKESLHVAWVLCIIIIALLALTIVPLDALAQETNPTSTGANGQAVWDGFKSMVFGPWGLMLSATIIFIGIFVWMRRGISEGLLVMVVGFFFFLVPALVIAFRNAGQTFATT